MVAKLNFFKSNDEKTEKTTPPYGQGDEFDRGAVSYSSENGQVQDEDSEGPDDLHRGMKPRQLSKLIHIISSNMGKPIANMSFVQT